MHLLISFFFLKRKRSHATLDYLGLGGKKNINWMLCCQPELNLMEMAAEEYQSSCQPDENR